MNLHISPGHALCGEVELPGDKSISHRAALFASLAEGESHFENYLVAGVTEAMLGALKSLGVQWELKGNSLRVEGKRLRKSSGEHRALENYPFLDCGNSATTMRLLAGVLVANSAPAILDGTQGLRHRPMQRIIIPLRQMGAKIEATDGKAPLVFHAASLPLQAIDYQMPVASAQVKSCLLLAGLGASGTTRLSEPGPSRDHTERMLRMMGVHVQSQKFLSQGKARYETRLDPPDDRSLAPLHLQIPGDFSAAAFIIVAALITPGSEVILKGVGLNPTRTGLLDVLQEMGGLIEVIVEPDGPEFEPSGDIVVRHSELHGTLVDGSRVVRMIDEFPAFAVAAAFAEGQTEVKEAGELRHKESDRIGSVCGELRELGVKVDETPDGFSVLGGKPLKGWEV